MAIPRIFKQSLAAVLISLLAWPAWTQSQLAGIVINSQAATMAEASLASGSSIFSGESVSVSSTGNAQIDLTGGGRVEVMRDSAVRLDRTAAGVQFLVLRGGASFAGGPKDGIETILGDATIRFKDPSSLAVLHLENPDSAVLATMKGKLTIKTEHDVDSVDVPEGSAVRITLVDPSVDPSEPQGGAQPAGRAAPALKKLALIVFLIGAAFLGIFLWIAAHEPTETPQQLGTEVSPFKVQ